MVGGTSGLALGYDRHLDRKVDLLLICGDFQAVRNEDDLACMACPAKYRHMNTFYKYYSGEKIAPVLTVFIGGNHEASNYLQELPFGGLVAPKIYYMGYAGSYFVSISPCLSSLSPPLPPNNQNSGTEKDGSPRCKRPPEVHWIHPSLSDWAPIYLTGPLSV